MIELNIYNLAFLFFSSITILSAIGVAIINSLMRSLFLLIISFIGVASLFVLLSADFIAIAQLLIYAGSISILLLFAVMLTPEISINNQNSKYFLFAALASILFIYMMFLFISIFDINQLTGLNLGKLNFNDTIDKIGTLLLGKYIIAFELASILLLFALIGAISIVRSDKSDFSIVTSRTEEEK
ncbi:MAG: NADH-quinone oxidoreductase subunit J [Dehalococcoidaceae bacterium]|nr:NADH-quinone oxidoreductase subunit J [Dehalococcoidaceae bacterium]